jgi:hypothetical protein
MMGTIYEVATNKHAHRIEAQVGHHRARIVQNHLDFLVELNVAMLR